VVGVLKVLPFQAIGISENGRCFVKRYSVFSNIPGGFLRIPGEHIYVYTIIGRSRSREIWQSGNLPREEIPLRRFVDFISYGQYKNF
jgi:hypothetical protein